MDGESNYVICKTKGKNKINKTFVQKKTYRVYKNK